LSRIFYKFFKFTLLNSREANLTGQVPKYRRKNLEKIMPKYENCSRN